MIETLTSSGEFEQKPHREIEKKYLPLFPERLDRFRLDAIPIEQIYLSHPSEEFSLRLRETVRDGELVYTATLKDSGQLTDDGLDRLEVETPVDQAIYEYYKQHGAPVIRKLRAEPYKNVVIDWFEDGHIHAESEHPASWAGFVQQHGLSHSFEEVTGDHTADNEWRTHVAHRRRHNGDEAITLKPELDSETIARQIWEHQLGSDQTVVAIAGRSGSGKTTIIRDIQAHLEQNKIKSIVLSTDDYHRGKKWLENFKGSEWTEWDAPIVYDIDALVSDLSRLYDGESIPKRRFDFETEEPILEGTISPTSVVIVEGIYARHPDLNSSTRYVLPTPLATCVGRRLLRDLRERPQFADPEKSLRYMLEQAEPAFQRQYE